MANRYAREIKPSVMKNKFRFSICTLVTRMDEYEEMVQSFLEADFTPDTCEFLYINNSIANEFDAFTGLNTLMAAAQGEHLILCHQDIRLNFDRREVLEARMTELDRMDFRWAVLGNAGMDAGTHFYTHISYPTEKVQAGRLPALCESLDENFLVVKRTASLRFSVDLKGFHFYSTDICRIAKAMGYTAWVVDFHLLHKSRGKADANFVCAARNMESKLKRLREPEYLQTVCATLYLGDSWFRKRLNEYRLLYYVRKSGGISDIGCFFTGSKSLLPLFWLLHRISRPFEQLAKQIKKENSNKGLISKLTR